jgi:type II secretory pathway component HofQ
MKYAAPILAALLIAGCAGTPEPVVENEPAPKDAEVPILQDIPTLGHLFERQKAKTVETKAQADVPLLSDIPLLGHLFKRTAEPDAPDTPDTEEGK